MQDFDKGPKRSSDEWISAEPKMGNGPMLSDEEVGEILFQKIRQKDFENPTDGVKADINYTLKGQPITQRAISEFVRLDTERFRVLCSENELAHSATKSNKAENFVACDIYYLTEMFGALLLPQIERLLDSDKFCEKAWGASALRFIDPDRAVREIEGAIDCLEQGTLKQDACDPSLLVEEAGHIEGQLAHKIFARIRQVRLPRSGI